MLKDLQNNFWLRRLHSLTGIVPIGLFLCFHLFANSTAIFNAENYTTVINLLRSIPFLEAVEWAAIFLPLLFHAVYGILINTTAKPNHMQYSHLENWRYIFQRVTGAIAFVYLFYHILQFRVVDNLDYNYIAKSMASYETISFLPEIPFINPFSVYWFYIIGLISIIYHFANGIWGFCITWGITVSKRSQNAVSILAIIIFVVLSYISIATANHLLEAGQAL